MEERTQGYADPRYAAAVSGRGSGAQTNAIAEPPLDQLSLRLSEAQKRIEESTARLANLADRLLGERLEKDPGIPHVNPDRSGKVGSLLDLADSDHRVMDGLESQFMRLSPLAG